MADRIDPFSISGGFRETQSEWAIADPKLAGVGKQKCLICLTMRPPY